MPTFGSPDTNVYSGGDKVKQSIRIRKRKQRREYLHLIYKPWPFVCCSRKLWPKSSHVDHSCWIRQRTNPPHFFAFHDNMDFCKAGYHDSSSPLLQPFISGWEHVHPSHCFRKYNIPATAYLRSICKFISLKIYHAPTFYVPFD